MCRGSASKEGGYAFHALSIPFGSAVADIIRNRFTCVVPPRLRNEERMRKDEERMPKGTGAKPPRARAGMTRIRRAILRAILRARHVPSFLVSLLGP